MVKKMEEYRLSEISQIEDQEERRIIQQFYDEKVKELIDTPFLRRVYHNYSDCSISELESIIYGEFLEKTSFYHFPNEQVYFYPAIREQKSEFNTTCCFSGSIIKRDSFYYCYRPLLDVITRGKVYVLKKTLKLETAYFSDLPTTISEFDIFTQKVENYWNYSNEAIDYEQLNYYLGGSVELLELKKKGRKL
ncbi:MAG: hypothetical protein HFG40_03245 [Bacilli bacterium]|nr:hypothetical protein [Bacilli bacterium]